MRPTAPVPRAPCLRPRMQHPAPLRARARARTKPSLHVRAVSRAPRPAPLRARTTPRPRPHRAVVQPRPRPSPRPATLPARRLPRAPSCPATCPHQAVPARSRRRQAPPSPTVHVEKKGREVSKYQDNSTTSSDQSTTKRVAKPRARLCLETREKTRSIPVL